MTAIPFSFYIFFSIFSISLLFKKRDILLAVWFLESLSWKNGTWKMVIFEEWVKIWRLVNWKWYSSLGDESSVHPTFNIFFYIHMSGSIITNFHISYSTPSICFQIIALSDKIWNHINPFLGNIAKRGEVLSLVRDVGKVSSGLLSFVTCFQPSWGPIPTFTFHLGFFFTFTFFT